MNNFIFKLEVYGPLGLVIKIEHNDADAFNAIVADALRKLQSAVEACKLPK